MHSNDESKELQLPPELEKAVKQMRDAKPVVTLYPWPDMKVGDSILFQAEGGESIDQPSALVIINIGPFSAGDYNGTESQESKELVHFCKGVP